jgi:hypothetical protein
MLDATLEQFGRVDILVNNAGACVHAPALEVTDEDWRHVMDVNLDAVWHCARVFGRHFVDQRSGVIVNIGSMSGLIVNRPQWQPAYNASKAAVHHLTRSLAAEWGPYGVRVNALAPGYIKTDMSPVDEPRYRRHWIEDAPLQRYGTVDAVGSSIAGMGSASVAGLLLCAVAAVTSAFASSAGILSATIPLAMPILAHGSLSTTGLVVAIALSATVVDATPFSTVGALAVASANKDEQNFVYRGLLLWGTVMVVTAPIVTWLLFVVRT